MAEAELAGGGEFLEETEKRLCTLDDVMERVEAVSDRMPDLPVYEIVRRFFGRPQELCIVALVDPWIHWCISLESACDKYGIPPYEGGWFDQPLWVINLFDEIRSVRGDFESRRMEAISGKGADAPKPGQRGSGKQHPRLLAPPPSALPQQGAARSGKAGHQD